MAKINWFPWLEERREETDFPSEAEEKIRKVLVETGRIIEAAKKDEAKTFCHSER